MIRNGETEADAKRFDAALRVIDRSNETGPLIREHVLYDNPGCEPVAVPCRAELVGTVIELTAACPM